MTLTETLRRLPRRRATLLIGIDGRGGAGKSTLARSLAAGAVIEFDDFYLTERTAEIGGNFDWRRLREQVLAPLAADRAARYQRYDWAEDRLAEWHLVEPGGVVIVEGNYCTRAELRPFYDFTIWVEAPHEVRLCRGLERDGESARACWLEEWMPEEERYVAAEDPAARVDLVVDGVT